MRLAPRSLSGRLLAGSVVTTVLALGLMLTLMHLVLVRFVTGQIDQRLDNKIVALASQLRVASDGSLSLAGTADGPPFDKRPHHSFWIVKGPRNELRTSWLADAEFAMPTQFALDEAFSRPPPPAPGPAVSMHTRGPSKGRSAASPCTNGLPAPWSRAFLSRSSSRHPSPLSMGRSAKA